MRGHREYDRVWTPRIGEILLLRRQRDNVHDPFADGVIKESTIRLDELCFFIAHSFIPKLFPYSFYFSL